MTHQIEDTGQFLSRTQRAAQRRFEAALLGVLATAEGRAVIGWILDLCGLHRPNPSANPAIEGGRAVGLHIVDSMIAADAFAYVDLLRELTRERQSRAISEAAEGEADR